MIPLRLRNTSRLCGICCKLRTQARNAHQSAVAPASEYSDEPEYPLILDTSPEARRRRVKEEWHDKVTNLPTVEQKIMELNMPKYYGYWSCRINDDVLKLNGLPFLQYATRTHVTKELPSNYYDEVREEASKVADQIQNEVETLIQLSFGINTANR